jgi:Zn-dependent protease
MLCHYCEQYKPGLPFRCNYCGDYFCSDHRLPENHACPRVGGPKQPGYSEVPSLQEKYAKSHGHFGTVPGMGHSRSRFRLGYPGVFSKAERKHILIAAGLLTAVGLSMMVFTIPISIDPIYLSIGIVGFLVSFFGHEIAHKLFAQRNGMWAEFRTNTYGLILTALSILPIPIKFLAPGQINIVGEPSRDLQGAIALVGPGFNVVFGTISIFAGVLVGFTDIHYALLFVGAFNGYMALFNLIPFMGFDGLKAFEWDRTRWAIALVGSIAVLAGGGFLLRALP